jgi:hypothetical protein
MQMRRNNQIGSVASFIAIAVVLVLITAGAIYFAGQRGDQARKDEATKSAEQVPQKSADQAPVNAPIQSASSPLNTTPVSANTNEDLPTTGMGSDIIRMLSLGILVASISSFTISRNNLKRSL